MTRSRPFALVSAVILAALFAASPPAAAQQPPRTVLRSHASEVLVDVTVTNRENVLLKKLKREDFVLYEDGVRQEIAGFQYVTAAKTPPAASKAIPGGPGVPAVSAQTPSAVAPPPGTAVVAGRAGPKYMMMLLDYSGTDLARQAMVRKAALQFIDQRLEPDDRLAVLVLDRSLKMLANFTNDRKSLAAAIRYGSAWGESHANPLSGVAAPIQQSPVATASQETQIEPTQRAGADFSRLYELLRNPTSVQAATYATRNVFDAIKQLAAATRDIPGRKPLVLFSNGFLVNRDIEFLLGEVTEKANRSRLVLYCIDTRGLNADINKPTSHEEMLYAGGWNPAVGPGPRQLSGGGNSKFDWIVLGATNSEEAPLRYLAEHTGGSWIHNSNDFSRGLERIREEGNEYYLLAYRPRNQELDGKFRRIRVQVNKRDVVVRGRDGYYAVPDGR